MHAERRRIRKDTSDQSACVGGARTGPSFAGSFSRLTEGRVACFSMCSHWFAPWLACRWSLFGDLGIQCVFQMFSEGWAWGVYVDIFTLKHERALNAVYHCRRIDHPVAPRCCLFLYDGRLHPHSSRDSDRHHPDEVNQRAGCRLRKEPGVSGRREFPWLR